MWYNISQVCDIMLKIKVNFDKKSYQTLLNDMKLFRIIKADGSPDKNRFMNSIDGISPKLRNESPTVQTKKQKRKKKRNI